MASLTEKWRPTSPSNYTSEGAMFVGNEYKATRDININITNVPKVTPTDEKISEWFGRLNFWSTFQDTLGRRHEGTGIWFLNHEKFVNWQQGTPKYLLCTGIPGSGKTVLSAIVVENLLRRRRDTGNIGVACIYCNYKDRQSAVSYLSSLVRQLLQQISAAPGYLKSVFEEHSQKQTQPGINEYYGILQSLTDQFSEAFLVVDALDECDKNETKNLMKILLKLSGTRVLIFSRDVPYVKHHLVAYPQLDIQANENDIKSYLDARIQEEYELSELIQEDPTLYNKIRTTIVDKSSGMFLLARLHLESLCEYDNCAAISSALDSLPTELYVSYDEAIKRIEKQSAPDCQRAKQVLMWISGALRPLRIDELREALAVKKDTTKLNRDDLPIGSRLISVCAGLVLIDRQSKIIKLAHETIQKYLEHKRSDLFPDAQEIIATACLTYLSFETFSTGDSSAEELEALLERNVFLDYASRYWGVHISEDIEKKLTELSLDFLQNDPKVLCSGQVMLLDPFSRPSRIVAQKISGVHLGAHFDLATILAVLLPIQSRPDPKDSNGQTPLAWAACLGNVAVVRLLMHYEGVNVNSEDNDGQTPLSRAAEEGHEAVVRALIEHDAVLIDSRDAWGMTPLAWAVTRGHQSVIKLLSEKGANVNTCDDDEETPFHYAVARKDEAVIRLLLQQGAQIPENDNCGVTALIWAAQEEYWDAVRIMIEKGVHPNKNISSGITILNQAIAKGQQGMVKFLIQHCAAVNPRNKNDRASLWFAIDCGQYSMIELLLELGADVNLKDDLGRSLIQWAVETDHADLLNVFVAHKANLNTGDASGRTPLWWAVENNRTELLRVLVGLGASIETTNSIGKTLAHWAVDKHQMKLLRMLHELGANLEAKISLGLTPLRCAVEESNEEMVALLVSLGANLETRDALGRTPLFWAAENRLPKIVRQLADLGASVDATNNSNLTAFRRTVETDQREMMDLLISLGANIEAKDSAGRTALHWAVEHSHTEKVKMLIDHRADVKTKDRLGKSSLHTVAETRHLEIGELLLQAGATCDEKYCGDTPFSLAFKRESVDMMPLFVKYRCKLGIEQGEGQRMLNKATYFGSLWEVNLLIENGIPANTGTYGSQNRTPLHVAAEKGHFDIMERLLQEESVRADTTMQDGWTALHLAARRGHLRIVQRLLAEDCVSVNVRLHSGSTPLHFAALNGYTSIVECLLREEGVIAEIKSAEGWTPLHLAAQNGHLSIVKRLLLENCVHADVKSDSGRTPLHLAASKGHIAIVVRLLEEGSVDVSAKTEEGWTPADFARRSNHLNVARLLDTGL